jgi:hypothetical protein
VLRTSDISYLDERGFDYSTYRAGNRTLLVLHDYRLPPGYSEEVVEVLIEVPDDFPDAQLDMWWVYPWVTFSANNQRPLNADQPATYPEFEPEPGRVWQRFSRHPPWRVGVDDLRSFLLYMENHFKRDVEAAQAA